jgi:hypothetical protein
VYKKLEVLEEKEADIDKKLAGFLKELGI